MLPKGALFDIVDKPNGGEVHVCLPLVLDHSGLCNVARLRCAADGSLERHGFVVADGSRELRRAEYVWRERVVVKTPDAMSAGGFEVIRHDKLSYEDKVSVGYQHWRPDKGRWADLRLDELQHNLSFDGAIILVFCKVAQLPQATQERNEAKLVARAVVDALGAAKAA